MERERLQREREELEQLRRQQQGRADDARKRPALDRDPYYDDRKRSNVTSGMGGSSNSMSMASSSSKASKSMPNFLPLDRRFLLA